MGERKGAAAAVQRGSKDDGLIPDADADPIGVELSFEPRKPRVKGWSLHLWRDCEDADVLTEVHRQLSLLCEKEMPQAELKQALGGLWRE